MVFQLSPDSLWFPDPRLSESDGLLAIGGDLSTARLLEAYSNGIFPWFSFKDEDEPLWYCPQNRFVIFPDEIHVSHSMRSILNKKMYEVSFNRAFVDVIKGCAEKRIELEGAWLGEDMIEAYTRLHKLGFASSVEVWENKQLVGGLYGVTIGRGFMGESMFSRSPGASKVALIALARIMEKRGGALIDCQFETPHLKSMGGRYITYSQYIELIRYPGWLPSPGHVEIT